MSSNHSARDGLTIFLPPIRSSLRFHRCVALAQPPLMLGTKPLRPCLIRDRASATPRTISTTTSTTAHTIYTVHMLRHLNFPPFQPRPNVSNTPAGPSLCVGTVARHPLRPGSLIPSNTPPLSQRAGIDVPVCQCSGERIEDGDGYLRGVPVGCTPSFLPVWWRLPATPSFYRSWGSRSAPRCLVVARSRILNACA